MTAAIITPSLFEIQRPIASRFEEFQNVQPAINLSPDHLPLNSHLPAEKAMSTLIISECFVLAAATSQKMVHPAQSAGLLWLVVSPLDFKLHIPKMSQMETLSSSQAPQVWPRPKAVGLGEMPLARIISKLSSLRSEF